jgi:hypothetical protein
MERALALAKHSRSVELKLTVPMTGHRDAAARIGIEPVEGGEVRSRRARTLLAHATWSGRWGSNPRLELGKLRSCH